MPLSLQPIGLKSLVRVTLLQLLVVTLLLGAAPIRVVTLGPAITNQILLLGESDLIMGKTTYCPKEAGIKGEVQVIGSLLSLSVESIVALKPTVVFASGLTPQKVVEQLKLLNISVYCFNDPSSFDELKANFKTIGYALKDTIKSDSILKVADSLYIKLKSSIPSPTKRVFFQLGSKPLYTMIKNSLGDELITLIGGENIFNLKHSGAVSRESVLLKNPEIIIISGMENSTEDQKNEWLKFSDITAVTSNAIISVNPYDIGSPTPISFIKTVLELRAVIHPLVYHHEKTRVAQPLVGWE